MRRLLPLIGTLALVGAVVVGLSQTGGPGAPPRSAAPTDAELRGAFAGSPAPLAALHAQANQLLGPGPGPFFARLRQLHGFPVVVNKWAAWCPPCRSEFPLFQRAGVTFGRQVAFLGLNSADVTADARGFLARLPVPYPSYLDPSDGVARAAGVGGYFPATLFYASRGGAPYIHPGVYQHQADLNRDIRRYALGP
ncbi:MAG TPA: TlpA disulfide reductase family protein [Solirubrobacteraceae bacterium]|jgi:thiol-disulfide isomerase/thioredoxin|nr:TlpA disulfide reductase family protein [Solirubrobacteraceae bacterium]